jgi:protein subunit release factor A
VFPDSDIVPNRTDKYPIHVEVTANVGGTKVNVWSGSQRDLFRKYASRRSKAIQEIIANLEDLKEEFE